MTTGPTASQLWYQRKQGGGGLGDGMTFELQWIRISLFTESFFGMSFQYQKPFPKTELVVVMFCNLVVHRFHNIDVYIHSRNIVLGTPVHLLILAII